MKLEHAGRARARVEAVHVLRDDRVDQPAALPVGHDAVAVVRGVTVEHGDAPAVELDVLVVGIIERVDGRQLLEATALLPKTAVGSEIGQARFGAHAGTGEHGRAPAGRYQ
jgi:hypothetical protein